MNKSALLQQDLSNTDSDCQDVDTSQNKSHVPRFGGKIEDNHDLDNDEIENFVENSDSEVEEDETELLTELRQLSRNLTTTRSTKRKLTDRQMHTFENFSSSKKSAKEFEQYYQKSVNRFLQKKNDDLENRRKLIEQSEALELTHKPNLIAKQQNKRHIPIAERAELVKAKKESEILKMKKAQEERMEKEFKQLTFAPKINRSSVSPSIVNKKRTNQNVKTNSRDQSATIGVKHEPSMSKPYPNSENRKNSLVASASKSVRKQLCGPAQAIEDKKKLVMNHNNVPNLKTSMNKLSLKIERIMTEPCGQADTMNEKMSLPAKKRNRRLSSERSRSPIENKAKLKENFTQDSCPSMSNQGQKASNKKAEEELLAKKFQEMLRDGSPQRVEGRKQRTKKGTRSPSNVSMFDVAGKSKLGEIGNKSPVINSHLNTIRNRTETNRDNNIGQYTLSQRENSPASLLGNYLRQDTQIEREKENIGNDDEIDIVSIKQNLLNIQDNLQTLKQSFKCFQNVQPLPKSYLSFVESPKDLRQLSTQSGDIKLFVGNNIINSIQLKDLQIENKSKQILTLNPDHLMKKYMKNEEKQNCRVLVLNKEHVIDNDTESFGNGNMSFSAAYEQRLGEKNLLVFTNKSSISIDTRKEDSMSSWKFPTDMEVGQSGCLEMSNLFSRPSSVVSMHGLLERKQESQPQSLKDVAETTLKKFKGVDR